MATHMGSTGNFFQYKLEKCISRGFAPAWGCSVMSIRILSSVVGEDIGHLSTLKNQRS